jgi:2-phosphosulfolactate phosphatase
VRGCVSGQELIGRGYAQDVEVAVQLDASDAAPLLVDGAYTG